MQNYPEAANRVGQLRQGYDMAPGALLDAESGSLKACHARTISKLHTLQGNTHALQDILDRLDGSRPTPGQVAGKTLEPTEPDHPTFTARKIEGMLDEEIERQRTIMVEISRLIG